MSFLHQKLAKIKKTAKAYFHHFWSAQHPNAGQNIQQKDQKFLLGTTFFPAKSTFCDFHSTFYFRLTYSMLDCVFTFNLHFFGLGDIYYFIW